MSKDEISVPRELLEKLRDSAHVEASARRSALGDFRPMVQAALDKVVEDVDTLLAQPNTCTKDGGQVRTPDSVFLSVPDECPIMIVFDDTDRETLTFAGAGSKLAALTAWGKISGSWNAHLFVRIERNSRDDRYPSASTRCGTQAPVVLPERKQVPGNGVWHFLQPDYLSWNACLDELKRLNPTL